MVLKLNILPNVLTMKKTSNTPDVPSTILWEGDKSVPGGNMIAFSSRLPKTKLVEKLELEIKIK